MRRFKVKKIIISLVLFALFVLTTITVFAQTPTEAYIQLMVYDRSNWHEDWTESDRFQYHIRDGIYFLVYIDDTVQELSVWDLHWISVPNDTNIYAQIYSAPGWEFCPEKRLLTYAIRDDYIAFWDILYLYPIGQESEQPEAVEDEIEAEKETESEEPDPVPEPTPVVEVVEAPEPLPTVEVIEAPAPAPVIQAANTAIVTNAHFLNLRRGAGVSYNAFAVLARGDKVTILSQRGGWVNVETARGTGWVFGRYLDI